MKEFKNFLQSDQIQALSDTSQSNYKYALQHFESFLLNDCECSELSHDTISNDTLSEFCKKMKAKMKSATTIKQFLIVLLYVLLSSCRCPSYMNHPAKKH